MMSKFGRVNRREERRAARQLRAQASQDLIWARDPNEPVIEERNTNVVSRTTRVSTRIVRYAHNKQIVEFAVIVDRFIDNEWRETLCIDTCNHGSIHRHRNNDHASEPEVIGSIRSANDIADGCWEAISEAYDEAERE